MHVVLHTYTSYACNKKKIINTGIYFRQQRKLLVILKMVMYDPGVGRSPTL
jgi:hypothetical protein